MTCRSGELACHRKWKSGTVYVYVHTRLYGSVYEYG
jgi:hypothetical protein